MSPDLEALGEAMEMGSEEVFDETQIRATLIELNKAGWFLEQVHYSGPRFTEAEIDHIQELVQADSEDSDKEVRIRLDEEDWGGVARWANKIALSKLIDEKIEVALPSRNVGSNPVTSGQR